MQVSGELLAAFVWDVDKRAFALPCASNMARWASVQASFALLRFLAGQENVSLQSVQRRRSIPGSNLVIKSDTTSS